MTKIKVPYNDVLSLNIFHKKDEGIVKLIQNGSFSENLQRLIIDITRPDDVLVDVGANIGLIALPVSFSLAKVICFEPIPETCDYLKRSIQYNHINNIEVYNWALGDEPDKVIGMKFMGSDTREKDSGHSVITENIYNLDNSIIPDFQVKMTMLDSFDFEKVDIIKIDVEGYEPFVLNGAVKTIEKFKPKLLIEHEQGHVICRNLTSVDIIKQIRDLGYKTIKAVFDNNGHYEMQDVRDTAEYYFKRCACFDLLCEA